jgi:hypothetical protein
MKTIYEILYENDRRKSERKKGKESLPDRYILKSVENMINNLEKEKQMISKDKQYKIIDNMINRFINDIKFKMKELEN